MTMRFNSSIRTDLILSAIIFVVLFSLYFFTAAPSVFDGDSGELTAAVHQLGLAHPTGFPLYMLTGKLFSTLFLRGDIAFRLNIYSSLLTAAAVALFFILLRSFDIAKPPSVFTSIIFGLGRNTIWSNAGVANVYALSLFFGTLLLILFSKWYKTLDRKFLYWYAFTFGLSLGSHAIMVVMVLPLILMFWREFKLNHQIKTLVSVLIVAALPLFQYLYLWIAYVRNTIVTWGDISSLNGFIFYITQRDYADKIFGRTFNDGVLFFNKLFKFLSVEFVAPFFIAALLGFFILGKKDKTFLLLATSLITSNVVVMFFYGNNGDLFVLYRYLSLIYVIFAIALAYFFNMLFALLNKNRPGLILLSAAILIFMWFQFKVGYVFNNRNDNFIISDFAENVFSSIGLDSIFITTGDPITGSAWYLQGVNNRQDLVIISGDLIRYDWYVKNLAKRYPYVISEKLLETQGVGNRLAKIFEDNITYRKIYSIPNGLKSEGASDFEFVPVGLVNLVAPKGADAKKILIVKKEWENYKLRNIRADFYKNEMIDNMTKYYLLAFNNTGMAYFRNGLLDEGENLLRKALDIGKDSRVESNLDQIIKQKSLIKL